MAPADSLQPALCRASANSCVFSHLCGRLQEGEGRGYGSMQTKADKREGVDFYCIFVDVLYR